MRKILLPFLFISSLFSANIAVSWSSTETQIAITYNATTTAACTISATDNNKGPSVSDLDTAKFTNANSDLSRTYANGFKWPTLINSNLNRTVFIGGHDSVKQGTDGKWYSLALQANTDHTITVSCNGGADTGTIHAQTQNIPLASYYPETLIPTPGSPLGGMPQPTITYGSGNYKVTDPTTGVVIQTLSQGTDSFKDTEPVNAQFSTDIFDLQGVWTNKQFFTTNQNPAQLATTATASAPLFVPFAANFPSGESPTDFVVTPFGDSDSSGTVAEWCLSVDSGQTCANYTPVDVNYSQGSIQAYPAIPSSTPSSFFSGWGGMKVAYGSYDLTNGTFGGVSSNGTLVSANITAPNGGFNLDRVNGAKFKLSNCGTGSGGIFTVNHTDAEGQITTVENTGVNTNCTYTDESVGIRVIKKNAGTIGVSFQAVEYGVWYAFAGSNGQRWVCARTKVNDIATDCDGNTRSPAISGYLCSLSYQGFYVIQDDGRMCRQGDLYGASSSPHLLPENGGQISPLDSRTFITKAFGGDVWKVQHIANNYTEKTADPTHASNGNMTYTDFTLTTPSIQTQIINANDGKVSYALSSGLWPSPNFDTVIDNGQGGASIQYNMYSGNQDSQCMFAWADANNTLISVQPMFGLYPISYAACHEVPGSGSGYVQLTAAAEAGQVGPAFFNSSILLGGPFVDRVTAIKKNGTFVSWTLPTITNIGGAPPATATSPNSDLDQMDTRQGSMGAMISCTGFTGNWTPLNTTLFAHFVDKDHFTLFSDAQGQNAIAVGSYGSYTGQSPTCTTSPPMYLLQVNQNGVQNNAGVALFTAANYYFNAFYPSGNLPMRDGDPVAVNSGGSMSSTTQYYAKVSGLTQGQFELATDAALNNLVPYSTASCSGQPGWCFYTVALAETCPDPATISWPSGNGLPSYPAIMFMDTGIGSSGAGNQKVRCVWLRTNGEFCSDWPKTGETAAYQCPGTNHGPQSMLHQINIGDGLMSLDGYTQNWEIDYVLKVDRSAGENQVDILVAREYGDDCGFLWRGCLNGIGRDLYAGNHSAGWGAWGNSVIPITLANTNTSPQQYAVPAVNGNHTDFVTGESTVLDPNGHPGFMTQASVYNGGQPDSRVNVPLSTYTTPNTTNHSSFPRFGQGASYSLECFGGVCLQSYPSFRTRADQTNPSERIWNSDWAAANIGAGFGQNNGDLTGLSSVLLKIAGTTYDLGATTSIVYKIPTQVGVGGVNEKWAPLLVTASPHVTFTDMSGPGSLITDSNSGFRCTAFVAGECRPNSIPGDTFVSGRGWYTAYQQCIANNSFLGSPCAFGLTSASGWAIQVKDTPLDINNSGVRRLTQGFWEAMRHYSYTSWVTTPDAKWGIFNPNSVQARAGLGQWFAMKLPPFPPTESLQFARQTYYQYPVKFPSGSGSIRIEFGYGENGNPNSFFCTTRAETCWTTSTPMAASPFVYASETQTKYSCSSGCTVFIPAIPGRILFYKIEYTPASGPISFSSLQVVLVP